MIYFDNAATTGKKPNNVIRATAQALENLCVNPGRGGYELSVRAAEKIYNVRQKTAAFFNANGGENVVFTLNCTQSINFVLKGVLKKGDHIIVSSLEHNAVIRPLERMKIPYSVAEVSLTDDLETVESFKRNIRPNTRMIFCTAASNVNGKILPLKELGAICKNRGLLFGVDAAQGAGVIPIDMKEMNIDYLCIAPHKGLYAPMGLGVLICHKNIESTIIEGGTGFNSLESVQPRELPERLESGTVNLPAIMGLGAGIDFVKQKGAQNLYNSEMNLAMKAYANLKNHSYIELYTPFFKKGEYVPVIPFNFKGLTGEKGAELLGNYGIAVRGGYHCAPLAHRYMNTLENGTVRLSFSAFNEGREIEYFNSLINSEKFLKNIKKTVE